MPQTRTIWVGWEDPKTKEPFRVRLSVTPGHEGRLYGPPEKCYPPEGPELWVLDVVEDRPDGQLRPDLVDVVEAELEPGDVLSDLDDDEPWPDKGERWPEGA